MSVHFGTQEIEQSRCLVKLLQRDQVFFDVGANVGFYSLLGSKAVGAKGRVVAFEPAPRNLAFLHRHLRLNKASNVTILPLACADVLSTQPFNLGENNALGHLDENAESNTGTSLQFSPLLVATVSLDDVVEKLRLKPDVIKIDVEGAELRVLEGATGILKCIRPSLLLSVHSDRLREACLAYLRKFDYCLEPLNSSAVESATEVLAIPAPS